ncbi:hypothetical protein PC115_g13871 [Phytophthora cactorum]|uniref:carbonic anhydrase n=1 Tax=Phytophthora cactorum TaxID=29920 RepID=A0A8T1BS13_9STRA|nr:hypothetical protein PC115_g13871 [Phytophthora cactorum]
MNGKPLDGEVHFVHRVMQTVLHFLDVVNSGKTDPFMVGSYSKLVNANSNRLYNYPGSLTTPGCDEIVDWWVVQTPISVSSNDFKRLQTQLKELNVTDNGKNARPILPLDGRKIISLKS